MLSSYLKNIPEKVHRKLLNIFDRLIVQNIKIKAQNENKSWKDKKIFIENGLDKVLIPLSQRKASDATLSVGRGTRIKIRLEDTLRLFVYWKQKEFRTDLDLSLIRFDEDLNLLGQVSYTNLQDGKIVHSGDIQSAEFGASEFIDIDFSAILDLVGDRNEYKTFFAKVNHKIFLKKGEKLENATRYLAPQIYRFAGEEFDEITCYSGWMIRKDTSSEFKTFDAKTVQNKFDVNGKGSYILPFVVDLYEEEIIFVDLFINALNSQNRVEGAYKDISTVIGEVIKMSENKPNIKDLAIYNTKALDGIITTNRDEADIVFGLYEGDYNFSYNVEKILNELI
ncbi:MAG: hypothetical protein Q8K30_06740 [Candidatus Gracilibacteria bacterium]|nr:hypothetical protein [Candidatus Gracilibacteria bacterium]